MATRFPFEVICKQWLNKIEAAEEYKQDVFGETAEECLRFYDGPHDFMYSPTRSTKSVGLYVDGVKQIKTTFRMTTNKLAEVVMRFGPSLYFNNPFRTVKPRKPEFDPQIFQLLQNPQMMQMAFMEQKQKQMMRMGASQLQSWYLNFTPGELDLWNHSRMAIDEALITGLGCLWTEVMQQSVGGGRLVGSFFDSWENLIIDPDQDTLQRAGYVVRRCCHPVFQVEREYNLPPGTIKGNVQSMNLKSEKRTYSGIKDSRPLPQTCDMLEYFKVYSKIGMGQYLSGADEDLAELLSDFGDYVYLVVAHGVEYPLNLPPELYESLETAPMEQIPAIEDQIKQNVRWPIPFWADDEWPVSMLGFHKQVRTPYPMAHVKPALGELRFINWVMSFLADKVYLTSRDIIAIVEHADEDLETKIKSGEDLVVIKFKQSMNRSINEMVQFLQHPTMNSDLLRVVDLAINMFDKRTFLTDIMYGMSPTQDRSAEESRNKKEFATVGLDDMREQTDQWQKKIARKEALAARWNIGPQDVAPMLGEQIQQPPPQMAQAMMMQGMQPQPMLGPLTQLWTQLVFAPPDYENMESLLRTIREYDYTIETDSIRKPNRERDIQNSDQAMQTMFQPFMQYMMQTGNPMPINGLLSWWAETRDIEPSLVQFPPPPPPQPPPQPGGERGGPPATIPMQQGAG